MLSDIFQHTLEEDTRQKVRAVDFGEPTSSNITQCDINSIRDNKCYKCGKDGHFIKDCPLNQDHSQYHHSQNNHKGGYSPLKSNETNSVIEWCWVHSTITGNRFFLYLKTKLKYLFACQNMLLIFIKVHSYTSVNVTVHIKIVHNNSSK